MENLWLKYRNKGLSVVAIENDRNREAALKVIDEKRLTFHFLENGEGEDEVVWKIFKVNGFPDTLVLDNNGKVVFFHSGWSKGMEAELEKQILKLLGD